MWIETKMYHNDKHFNLFLCVWPLVSYIMEVWGPLHEARGTQVSPFTIVWPSRWFSESQTPNHSISHKWKQICFVRLVFSPQCPRLSFYEPSLASGHSGHGPVWGQSNRLSYSSGQLYFQQQWAFPSLFSCACCQGLHCISEIVHLPWLY